MILDVAFVTDPGPRTENQDAIGTWPTADGGIGIAVADGLGGHSGGLLAATTAVQMFGDRISAETHPSLPLIALDAHKEIRRKQQETPELRGMATTFSAVLITPSVDKTNALLRFVHCGDTRIALQRNKGIRKLTQEHSEAQRLFEAGLLSKDEFRTYPRKNILESALGVSGEPRIDYDEVNLQEDDRVFLTSDGAHTKVLLREMLEISICSETAEEFISTMVTRVRERKPEDNITVAAIFV